MSNWKNYCFELRAKTNHLGLRFRHIFLRKKFFFFFFVDFSVFMYYNYQYKNAIESEADVKRRVEVEKRILTFVKEESPIKKDKVFVLMDV